MADSPAAGPRSRGFTPTALVGLAAAVLATVAAGRDWATASGDAAGVRVTARAAGSSSAPLALSLALVALAAWGVVLVVRGRARRVVAAVGALAAAGVLVTALAQGGRARSDGVAEVVARGGTAHQVDTSLTGWFFVCAVGAALTLAALAVAAVLAPRWPGMGSRYDAPSARPGSGPGAASSATATAPASEQELWRTLDDGRDPTV